MLPDQDRRLCGLALACVWSAPMFVIGIDAYDF